MFIFDLLLLFYSQKMCNLTGYNCAQTFMKSTHSVTVRSKFVYIQPPIVSLKLCFITSITVFLEFFLGDLVTVRRIDGIYLPGCFRNN